MRIIINYELFNYNLKKKYKLIIKVKYLIF